MSRWWRWAFLEGVLMVDLTLHCSKPLSREVEHMSEQWRPRMSLSGLTHHPRLASALTVSSRPTLGVVASSPCASMLAKVTFVSSRSLTPLSITKRFLIPELCPWVTSHGGPGNMTLKWLIFLFV